MPLLPFHHHFPCQGGLVRGAGMALDRAAWLRQARSILAEDHPAQSGELTVTLTSASCHQTTLRVPDESALPGRPLPALSPIEEDVVRCLRDHAPLIGKALARRLGVPYDSGFRTLLANLCERRPPVLSSSRDGYRLVLD